MVTTTPPRKPIASNASLSTDSIRKAKYFYQFAKTYEITLYKTVTSTPQRTVQNIPTTITWLTPDPQNPSQDQLFVDHHPIGKANWTFNPDEETLSWHQGSGENSLSGTFQMFANNLHGQGFLKVGNTNYSVAINVKPVTYYCNLSANAGAYIAGKTATNLNLVWDTDSDAWQKADWEKNRLTFTYGMKGEIKWHQKNYLELATFKDNQTGVPWEPGTDNFTLLITPDFRFVFEPQDSAIPPNDPIASGEPIETVFPYLFAFDFDGFAVNFTGAMLTKQKSPLGKVYAVTGSAINPATVGFYALQNSRDQSTILGIFNGKLYINQQPVLNSWQEGDSIHWENLSVTEKNASLLPEQGSLQFSADGNLINSATGFTGKRISGEAALAHSASQAHPELLTALNATTVAGDDLDIQTLLNMSQYQKDKDGNWTDVIQQSAMSDFYDILQAYMDSDLRKKFLSDNPPNLEAKVQEIAKVVGKNGTQPQTWYQELSISYLVNALSTNPEDPYAATLNAKRAQNYLTQRTSVSDVFQTQSSLLYGYRWQTSGGTNGQIGHFLADQKNNQQKYAQWIEEDLKDWKDNIDKTVEPDGDNIKELKKGAEELAEKAKQGKYWAWIFFQFATQPSALMLLKQISLSPTTGLDGSAFTRRIQSNCAVLSLLDESGYFTQQYAQVIQLFQIGNILPTLIDYGGDLNGYYFAVEEILQAFVDQYVNSSDPQMKEQAEKIQEAINEGYITDILEGFQALAASLEGIFGLSELLDEFAKKLAKVEGSPKWKMIVTRLGAGTVNLIGLCATAAAIAGLVIDAKKWKDLNATEKAQIILGGAELFTQITAAVVKRGVAFKAVYDSVNGWEAFKGIFTGKNLEIAATHTQTELSYWIVRKKNDPLTRRHRDVITGASTTEEASFSQKLFGRNLDDFLATRLGSVFAILNLVLFSFIVANSEDQDELQKASNGLFLASSCIEVIAAVGAWALQALGVEAIGGLAVSSICAVLGPLAVIAAVAGVIIMLVEMFKHHPSAIESFATDQAKKAHYYMSGKADIESFQVYQLEGQPERTGISLAANGNDSQCLQFHSDGSLTASQQAHNETTAFYMDTEYRGYARFLAVASDNYKGDVPLCLTLDDNQKLLGAAPIQAAEKLEQQRWVAELQGDVTWANTDNKFVQKANFYLYNAYWNNKGQKRYLSLDNGQITTSTSPTSWKLEMVSLECKGLTMDSITLHSYMRDSKYSPSVEVRGSFPLTW